MPPTGAHGRSRDEPLSMNAPTTTTVTPAHTGAAAAGYSAGTSSSMPRATGTVMTGTSIMAVPDTVGVSRRRSRDIRHARANCTMEAEIARRASMATPPAFSASAVTAMAALAGPAAST